MTTPEDDDNDTEQSCIEQECTEQEWELEILGQLCSAEAVEAFELLAGSIRVDTAPQLTTLLRTINTLSGPGFAERASAALLDALADTGEVELAALYGADIDDPIGALALAQTVRLVGEHRQILGERFGL